MLEVRDLMGSVKGDSILLSHDDAGLILIKRDNDSCAFFFFFLSVGQGWP